MMDAWAWAGVNLIISGLVPLFVWKWMDRTKLKRQQRAVVAAPPPVMAMMAEVDREALVAAAKAFADIPVEPEDFVPCVPWAIMPDHPKEQLISSIRIALQTYQKTHYAGLIRVAGFERMASGEKRK